MCSAQANVRFAPDYDRKRGHRVSAPATPAVRRPFKVRPHMLRHATGHALANKGTDTRTLQAYLGHRSIQSTVRYTELAPGRFKNLWR
jgi:type 1 fimbriae regulatory protein FimB/type 1 fimbriae regulatory protein FimE